MPLKCKKIVVIQGIGCGFGAIVSNTVPTWDFNAKQEISLEGTYMLGLRILKYKD